MEINNTREFVGQCYDNQYDPLDPRFRLDAVISTSSTSSSSSSSSSSTTTTSTAGAAAGRNTQPGVSYSSQDIEDLQRYFEACIGAPMNSVVMQQMFFFIRHHGIGLDVIRAAVTETALARRPTPRYFLAILERCACDEICTVDDWIAAKHQWRAERRSRRGGYDG